MKASYATRSTAAGVLILRNGRPVHNAATNEDAIRWIEDARDLDEQEAAEYRDERQRWKAEDR